jgi:hypothetical protein
MHPSNLARCHSPRPALDQLLRGSLLVYNRFDIVAPRTLRFTTTYDF